MITCWYQNRGRLRHPLPSVCHGWAMPRARKRSKRSGARRHSRNPIHPPQSWPMSFRRSIPSASSDGEHVGRHLLLGIAARRRVRPAETAQVEGEDAVALGERGEQMPPLVPMLWPAMQEEDDVVAGAGLGDMEGDPVGPDEPMATPSTTRDVGGNATAPHSDLPATETDLSVSGRSLTKRWGK